MLLEHFLAEAARELGEEMKVIPEDTMNFLVSLPWQGNVRQLENFSRWITVMATGREVLLDDLPLELRSNSEQPEQSDQLWDRQLRKWAQAKLKSRTFSGDGLLAEAQPLFERIMIEAALDETAGRKRDASLLLGWGRNTLTRKMQELGMDQRRQRRLRASWDSLCSQSRCLSRDPTQYRQHHQTVRQLWHSAPSH